MQRLVKDVFITVLQERNLERYSAQTNPQTGLGPLKYCLVFVLIFNGKFYIFLLY